MVPENILSRFMFKNFPNYKQVGTEKNDGLAKIISYKIGQRSVS